MSTGLTGFNNWTRSWYCLSNSKLARMFWNLLHLKIIWFRSSVVPHSEHSVVSFNPNKHFLVPQSPWFVRNRVSIFLLPVRSVSFHGTAWFVGYFILYFVVFIVSLPLIHHIIRISLCALMNVWVFVLVASSISLVISFESYVARNTHCMTKFVSWILDISSLMRWTK